jgi:hypothetical protein
MEDAMKPLGLRIEELEERIAPVVHAFTPIADVGAVAASGGSAGGAAAAGALGDTGQISGFPVPLSTPGTGA